MNKALFRDYKKSMTINCFIKKKILIFIFSFIFTSCTHKSINPKILEYHKNIHATVVIDPGHGGKDSGAVGRSGLTEKEITLDVALYVKKILQVIAPNIKVILTRKDDTYVSLEERIRIAHSNKAQIFLSIHVNSSEVASSSGFEVYSLDVANNKHSEKLALRENKSFDKEKNKVKFILADLRANANRKESDKLANDLLYGIHRQIKKSPSKLNAKDRGYNQALFHVLFVKMPAVLAEMFFISNPQEEKLLKKTSFRIACAKGLSLGIINYLKHKK